MKRMKPLCMIGLLVATALALAGPTWGLEILNGVEQGGTSVSDTAYAVGWNGDTTTAPSKNAVYDKIETLAGGHDAVTLGADAGAILGLSTQEITLDTQTENRVFAGPATAPAADPTFRLLVAADIPDISATYMPAALAKDIVTTAPLTVNGGASLDNVLPGADADVTLAVSAATETATGVVELATTAEVVTGTDSTRAVTAAGVTARLAAPGAIGGTTPAAGTFTTLVGKFDEHVEPATDTLTAAQLSRGFINNYGQVALNADATLTLPAAAEGLTFVAIVGEQEDHDWKFLRNGAETIYTDIGGTLSSGKTYIKCNNQPVGSRMSCATFQTGAGPTYSWLCGSISGTWTTD